jgi:hypothetical protein
MYVYCGVVSATCTSIVWWFLLHVRLLCGGLNHPTIDVHVAETTIQYTYM